MRELSRSENNPAEIEVLLHCARCDFGASAGASLRALLAQPLDWRFLLRQASRHGLLGLVFANLTRQNCLPLVPRAAVDTLKSGMRDNMARTLALTSELTGILDAFNAAGIPAIPFKGPALAVAAYGDISLRTFSDLDILVAPQDLEPAREALRALGYDCALHLGPREHRAYVENECALQLRHQSRGHIVELHWRFSERNASIALPVSAFRTRATTLRIAGRVLAGLSPEDLVLYLCVHGTKHRWERLEWIGSLAGVINRNPQFDWTAACDRAREYRIVRMFHLGLLLARPLLFESLPRHVEAELAADPDAALLSSWVMNGLFAAASDEPHYYHRAVRYWFLLRSREHWSDRFRIVTYSAIRPPHPDAAEWVHLPPRLAFLQHILRPARLLGEYGMVAWHHYRHSGSYNRTSAHEASSTLVRSSSGSSTTSSPPKLSAN
jgi:hypothetical protein